MLDAFRRNPHAPINDGLYLESLEEFEAGEVRESIMSMIGEQEWTPTPSDVRRQVLKRRDLASRTVRPTPAPQRRPANQRERNIIRLAYADATPQRRELAEFALRTAERHLTADELEQDV